MVKSLVELFLGLALFAIRITFSVAFALIAGLVALVFNSLRTSPEDKLRKGSWQSWGSTTGLTACPRCASDNESDRTYCYHCGAPLMSPTDVHSVSDVRRSVLGVISSAIAQSPFREHPGLLVVALVLVVLVVFLIPAAQQNARQATSITSTQAVSAPARSVPSLTLGVFNYGYRDSGETNWRIGYVTPYYINPAQESIQRVPLTITGGELETKEGHTYPLIALSVTGDIKKYQGSYMSPGGGFIEKPFPLTLESTAWQIPPQVPIVGYHTYGTYILGFRFATAATPTRLHVNTSQGAFSFALSEVPKELPIPDRSVFQFSSYAGIPALFNSTSGNLDITYSGECEKGTQTNISYSIPYTFTNLNKFENTSASHVVRYGVYFPTGLYREDDQDFSHTLGPGEIYPFHLTWAAYLGPDDPAPLLHVLYTPDGVQHLYPGGCE